MLKSLSICGLLLFFSGVVEAQRGFGLDALSRPLAGPPNTQQIVDQESYSAATGNSFLARRTIATYNAQGLLTRITQSGPNTADITAIATYNYDVRQRLLSASVRSPTSLLQIDTLYLFYGPNGFVDQFVVRGGASSPFTASVQYLPTALGRPLAAVTSRDCLSC